MGRIRARILFALLLGVLLAAAGCGGGGGGGGDVGGGGEEGGEEAGAVVTGAVTSGEGEAEEGGTLTIALAEEPDALDPTLARTFVGRIVFASICEKLYDVDENLELVPQLAADMPEISGDGRTVTIRLREGVKFNDGTPFDAEAVKVSLDRHRNLEGSSRTSELLPVRQVRVVDPLTVELRLSDPFSPLTSLLADRAGMIMSPAQLEKLGDNFGRNPVCVGPFKFVNRVAADRIVVEKSDQYYDADRVKLDEVVYQIISEPNVRGSNLRSGDVDVAERIEPTELEDLRGDPNVQVLEVTSLGYQGITINVGNKSGIAKPFEPLDTPLSQHPELREAFELSIDRETLNRVVFSDAFVPGCSPISPVSPWAEEDLECPGRDIERAKQLVSETGVQTPIQVTLMTDTDAVSARLGQLVQSMAKEAGFAVKVQPTEFTTALDRSDAGNFETFQIGWSGRIDPDGNIYVFHHTKGSLNVSGASDPEIDRLLDEARVETDRAKREEIYREALDLIRERRNIIYLYHQNLFTGARKNVVGLRIFGDGLLRVDTAGFAAGS